MSAMSTVNPATLRQEASEMIDHAEAQRRDLSDFECGQVEEKLQTANEESVELSSIR